MCSCSLIEVVPCSDFVMLDLFDECLVAKCCKLEAKGGVRKLA